MLDRVRRAQEADKPGKPSKRKKAKPPKSDPGSPYLRAREEWNERYGSYMESARQWRRACFLSLGISIPAVIFALWSAGQTKVVPYVVEIGEAGQVRAAGPAQQVAFQPDYIIEAELADFILNWRVVTVDRALQLDRLNETYVFLSPSGTAKTRLDRYYRGGGNPFDVAKEKTRSASIANINRVSPNSFSIQWVEQEFDRTGTELGSRRYQGILTYAIVQPTSEAVIRANPLGVYVTEIDYSEVMQ